MSQIDSLNLPPFSGSKFLYVFLVSLITAWLIYTLTHGWSFEYLWCSLFDHFLTFIYPTNQVIFNNTADNDLAQSKIYFESTYVEKMLDIFHGYNENTY